MDASRMNCRICGLEIEGSDRFCQWCGSPNSASDGPGVSSAEGAAGPAPATSAGWGEELRSLRTEVDSMTDQLGRVSLRLSVLEDARGTSGAPRQAGPSPAPPSPPPAATPAETYLPRPPSAEPQRPPAASFPAPVVPAGPFRAGQIDAALGRAGVRTGQLARPQETASAEDGGFGFPKLPPVDFSNWNWEWLLGGNWLARIGTVALILGVAFFISLAIDRGWLGEIERVALGIVGGLAFLGAGEYWRRRYAVWAQTVTGGGLAILYLSVYGAFALYDLISPLTAFGAFSLITLAGAVLSLRHESVAVAVFSIFGGFATPLLLQERLPDQRVLLGYVLVLDVGVLALASFRDWRWFTLLAWVGSLVLFGFWHQQLEPPTALAQIGISAIFLIFAGATVAFHVVRRQQSGMIDLALITLNAAAFYGISYLLIYDEYRPWMGGFTASLGAFYALMAAACRMRGEAQFNLTLFSAGLAVLFAVLAVPIQFGGPWVSVAWGVEGLILLWMSFPLRMRELRWAGYAMFLVSAVWLVAVDTPDAFSRDFRPFLNEYMISYAAAVFLPALAGYLLHLRRANLPLREQVAIPVFALRAAVFAAVVVPVQLDGIWISIGWAVEAAALLWLSFPLRIRELRWFGYVMYLVCAAWLVAVDSPGAFEKELLPFLNFYALGYLAVILTGVQSAWLLWYKRDDMERYEQLAYPLFAVGAAAAAAIAVPMQLEWPWITVAWAAEVLLLVWLSFLLKTREIRWFGYVLSVVFAAWLLGWDMPRALGEDFAFFLNWHMLNFGVAVLASILTGYLLWRRRDALEMREQRVYIVFALAAAAFAAIAAPVQLEGAWISVAWAAEAVLMLAISERLALTEMRWFSYGLLAAMVVRLLALDTFDVDLDTFRPALNWRFLAFAAGVAALCWAGWMAFRRTGFLGNSIEAMERKAALPILLVLANALSLWLLSAEIITSAYSEFLDLPEDARENVASLGLSLLWAVYAAALIVLGIVRRLRWIRLAGLALLAVPVVKLFAFDSLQLEQEYRVIAFLSLGLMMVAGGLLYQRYSKVVRGFLFE